MPVKMFGEISRPRRTTERPGALAYKQDRSKQTYERLIAAGEKAIAAHGFDDVSVADICRRAGLSVGAFYRRFESKEALLHALHERYVERMLREVRASLDPDRWKDASIADIVSGWLTNALDVTRHHLALARASTQRQFSDAHFAEREAMLQAELYTSMSRLLLTHASSIGHPDPPIAVEFVSRQIGGMMRDWFYNRLVPSEQMSDAQFIDELVRACLSYLEVD